jgi:hypothetical protein
LLAKLFGTPDNRDLRFLALPLGCVFPIYLRGLGTELDSLLASKEAQEVPATRATIPGHLRQAAKIPHGAFEPHHLAAIKDYRAIVREAPRKLGDPAHLLGIADPWTLVPQDPATASKQQAEDNRDGPREGPAGFEIGGFHAERRLSRHPITHDQMKEWRSHCSGRFDRDDICCLRGYAS